MFNHYCKIARRHHAQKQSEGEESYGADYRRNDGFIMAAADRHKRPLPDAEWIDGKHIIKKGNNHADPVSLDRQHTPRIPSP